MRIGQLWYLGTWWISTRIFGKRKPLQSVIFISDRCNLSCKHCSVYNHVAPVTRTFEQIREDLEYCYSLGSRFVDFEGGEPFLWTDGDRDINDLCRLAHEVGFFSCTVTTNAQKPFAGCAADSIWVSMDGVGEYHEKIRGEGTWARLEENIASCGHKALSVNMVVNNINRASLGAAIEYAASNPAISQIAINLHTPFPGTAHLTLSEEDRAAVLDEVIAYKKKGYPIMNSVSGLRRMKDMEFTKYCWMSNFVFVDGTRTDQCIGAQVGSCERCGFCMAGEEWAVMNLRPDTLLAGLSLRV